MEITYKTTTSLSLQTNQTISTQAIQEKKVLSLKELIELERNPRKNKKININLTGTKYDVIFEVARDYFNWNIISKPTEPMEDWHIQWYDTYISADTLRAMLPYQKINHFPGSYNLGRKNLLARNLMKISKYLPNEYNFFPKTWLLPYQFEEMKSFVENNNEKNNTKNKIVLIVKPEASCQGRGIFLTKKIDSVITPTEHYVVQEYITEPYLIDGYKFDLRIYALVKSIQPLKIFVYREGLARFATTKYERPNKKNMKNMFMHLTNYAVNKKNPEFQFNEEETNDAVGHKRSFTAILKHLEEQGENSEKVFDEICNMISKTICPVQPHLSHIYRTCQPKEENSEMCFELFGFDIMIDKNLKPYVLEVNHTPSFTTDSPLDLHIKRNLILDTLMLMNITNKAKQKYIESKNVLTMGKVFTKLTPQELDIHRKKIIAYEDNHMGGYYRVYPIEPEKSKVDYQAIFETSLKLWNEMTNPKKSKQSESISNQLSLNNTNNNLNTLQLPNAPSNTINVNANSNKLSIKKTSCINYKSEPIQYTMMKKNTETISSLRTNHREQRETAVTGSEYEFDKVNELVENPSKSYSMINQTQSRIGDLPTAASSNSNIVLDSTNIIIPKQQNNSTMCKDISNRNVSYQITHGIYVNSLACHNLTKPISVSQEPCSRSKIPISIGSCNTMSKSNKPHLVINQYPSSQLEYKLRFKSYASNSPSCIGPNYSNNTNEGSKKMTLDKSFVENENLNQSLADIDDSDKSGKNSPLKIPLEYDENNLRCQSSSPLRKIKRPSSSNFSYLTPDDESITKKTLTDQHKIDRSQKHESTSLTDFQSDSDYLTMSKSKTVALTDIERDREIQMNSGEKNKLGEIREVIKKELVEDIIEDMLNYDLKATFDKQIPTSRRNFYNKQNILNEKATTPIKINSVKHVYGRIPAVMPTQSNIQHNFNERLFASSDSESKHASSLQLGPNKESKEYGKLSIDLERSKNAIQILDKINCTFDNTWQQNMKNQVQNSILTNRFKISQKFITLKTSIFNDSINFCHKDPIYRVRMNYSPGKLKKVN